MNNEDLLKGLEELIHCYNKSISDNLKLTKENTKLKETLKTNSETVYKEFYDSKVDYDDMKEQKIKAEREINRLNNIIIDMQFKFSDDEDYTLEWRRDYIK